jgi:hypothetical protein
MDIQLNQMLVSYRANSKCQIIHVKFSMRNILRAKKSPGKKRKRASCMFERHLTAETGGRTRSGRGRWHHRTENVCGSWGLLDGYGKNGAMKAICRRTYHIFHQNERYFHLTLPSHPAE